ncbi:MAG: ABC transporter ATP-binding protein [Zavarzinella sp.]
MMELVDVTKQYTQGENLIQAVKGVSLTINAGEFVSIMGPSGSGKSTLLHMLGTLDTPTTGRVLFHGQDLQELSDRDRSRLRRTKLGFVFQFFNLLPTLRSDENVALPLLLGKQRRGPSLKKARQLLDYVGISHRVDHFPDQMSGGEMQRVAIARALISEPEIVLCDEPTGNLDSNTSKAILSLLQDIPKSMGRSLVMVTHDRTAAEYGDRIFHIRDGLLANTEILSRQTSSAV